MIEPRGPASSRRMADARPDPEDPFFIPADYFQRLRKEEIFPAERAWELDVGCGDGGFLIEMARRHPERDFLGLERLLGRARKVGRRARGLGLANVKVLRLESSYALEWLLPLGSLSRLHLLFPDPWPKKRHHERRLVREATVPHFAQMLVPGGEFLFKSDHEEYFAEARAAILASGLFTERPWGEDEFYPLTDFEKQWLAEGRKIHRARFVTWAEGRGRARG